MKDIAEDHQNAFGRTIGLHERQTYVYGYLLEEGDVLTENDVYDSSNGHWEKCPVPGLPIGAGGSACWVRPYWSVNDD